MKQTAVKEYTKNILNLITDAMDNDLSLQWLKDKIELETSLEYVEMEKEQHQETFKQSRSANIFKENMTPAWESFEQYYNETFKSE